MRRYRLPGELGAFADFENLPSALRTLAVLAAPESWQFKTLRDRPCQPDEILLRHMMAIFQRHSEDYAGARDQREEDESIYFDRRFACFRTGLHTADGRAIFMLFVKNPPDWNESPWTFREYILEDGWWIRNLKNRPQYPNYLSQAYVEGAYRPEQPLLIEFRRMLMNPETQAFLPVSLRTMESFQPSVKAALAHARKQAALDHEYAARVVWKGRVEYALPLYLNGWQLPDAALLIRPERDGRYVGHLLALPEVAYLGARLLGPIRASWLQCLVVQPEMETPLPQRKKKLIPEDINVGRSGQAMACPPALPDQ